MPLSLIKPRPIKRALILSKDSASIELLRTAITATGVGVAVEVFDTDQILLQRLYEMRDMPPASVFIDLDGCEDGVRLVEWLRFSPPTRRLRVVVLGEKSAAMERFRQAFGSETALTKPLNAETVRDLLTKDEKETRARPASSRPADRRRLIEAIAESKRLRAEQQRLVGSTDALLAEIKDRKLPFKRAQVATAKETISLCRRTVLYAARNAAHRHFFSTAVSQAGATFSVQFVRNFAEVVGHLREKGGSRRITSDGPCCLVVDSGLVDESTSDVLRWVRTQSSFPELMLVVLGETDSPQTVAAVYRAGADYYLARPKSFEGLIAIVNVLEAGLAQTPPQCHHFLQLPEYRDAMGNPVVGGESDARAAE
jgi:DNA-binding response OmpR family regulator